MRWCAASGHELGPPRTRCARPLEGATPAAWRGQIRGVLLGLRPLDVAQQGALDQGRGVLDEGVAVLVANELTEKDLASDRLRSALVARAASKVAAIPEVRKALLEFQRRFAEREGGAVLDGRDIGTVIAPEAEVKLFVTASVAARAMRRWNEMRERGEDHTLAEIEADLHRRDKRDRTRAEAPLVAAPEAILLDTSALGREAAIARAIALAEQAMRAH